VEEDAEAFTYEELVKADRMLNVGMSLELMSAYMYAKREGTSAPEYIIRILRAERDRRQEVDAVIRDRDMVDGIIDDARKAGVPIVEYIMSGAPFSSPGEHQVASPWKLNPDFLAKLLTLLEERASGDVGDRREQR